MQGTMKNNPALNEQIQDTPSINQYLPIFSTPFSRTQSRVTPETHARAASRDAHRSHFVDRLPRTPQTGAPRGHSCLCPALPGIPSTRPSTGARSSEGERNAPRGLTFVTRSEWRMMARMKKRWSVTSAPSFTLAAPRYRCILWLAQGTAVRSKLRMRLSSSWKARAGSR